MCIFFHKWGKWQEYKLDYVVFVKSANRMINSYDIHQKRVCERCGKVQDEFVR